MFPFRKCYCRLLTLFKTCSTTHPPSFPRVVVKASTSIKQNESLAKYNKLNGSQITQKNTCNVQNASSARKPTVSTLEVIKFESHKLKLNRSKRKEQYKHGVLWNFQCTQNSEFTRVRKMPNISVFYLSSIDIHHIKLNNWKLMNTKTWEPQTYQRR